MSLYYRTLIQKAKIPMLLTVDTTKTGVSASNQFQLPFTSLGTYNVSVNWGDGTSDTITSYNQSETLHTYSSGGVYTIELLGEIGRIAFNNGGDKLKLSEVVFSKDLSMLNLSDFAFGCTNLTTVDANIPPNFTDATVSFFNAFRSCTGLTSLDFNNWDLRSFGSNGVNNLTAFVLNSSNLTVLGVDQWDVSRVSNFNVFAGGLTLNTSNYDSILIGWEQGLQNSFPNGSGYTVPNNFPSFGNSKYTLGSACSGGR